MEEKEEKITVDDITPTGVASFVDVRNSVMLQHGGVVTRLEFDALHQMDLETFLNVEVPQLKRQTDNLYVIRNAAAGEFMLLLDDQVLRYRVTDINDIGIDVMRKYMKNEESESMFITDIQYPLVSIYCNDGMRRITVRVPSTFRKFHSQYFGIETAIYPPDCWFRNDLTLAGVHRASAIVATPYASVKAMDTQIYRLPFGNVWNENNHGGSICFGSAVCRIPNGMELTDAVHVSQRIEMFFGSGFNNHLLYENGDWNEIIGSAFDEAPNRDAYAKKLSGLPTHEAGFIKLICVLEEPGAWRKIHYRRFRENVSADMFIRGAI